MNFETGSVSRTFPSSIIIMMAVPTIGFVIDMMRNIESVCIGRLVSMSATPYALSCAIRPLRATSVTAPEKLLASRCRFTSASTCWRRSDESPTSSGRTVVPAPDSGHAATKHTSSASAHRVVVLIMEKSFGLGLRS